MRATFSSTPRLLVLVAAMALATGGCGSSETEADAGGLAGDADIDAATDNQLREDFCGYWPLDPGPSCGEELFGSVGACIETIEACEDHELLGVGFCWETADERCDANCLPDCAAR